MPIYEYQCSSCGHTLEELQSMSEPPLVKCPDCGKDTLQRLIGGGAGLIFKGSGFYLTDYKKSSESEKSKTDTEKKSEIKQDTKQDTKQNTKQDTKADKKSSTGGEKKSSGQADKSPIKKETNKS